MSKLLLLSIFFVFALVSANHATLNQLHQEQLMRQNPVTPQPPTAYWFDQKLDHFDPQSTATYKQRFFMNLEHYKKGGAVFVYIGGEGPLSGYHVYKGEMVENAKKHNAACYSLEHRYYGESQPFGDLTTEHLRYLSSQQALADLAMFIQNRTQIHANATVFTFGGSYPGSLSAWFRIKYPHVTSGSVASSAPVLAKADFFEYDQVVAEGAGTECSKAIRTATAQVEAQLATNATFVKELFGCGALGNDEVEFLYAIADAVAYSIQYTSSTHGTRYHLREKLCSTLQNKSADPLHDFAAYVRWLFQDLSTTCEKFAMTETKLGNTAIIAGKSDRQWYYQSCVEFGYFQVAPKTNALRSQRINLEWHIDMCRRAFGVPLKPDTVYTNKYYGGQQPRGTRIYFPNGSLDPWRKLGVTEKLVFEPTEIPRVIKGTAHCADLGSTLSTDPADLTAARNEIRTKIDEWISEYNRAPSSQLAATTTLGIGIALIILGAIIIVIAIVVFVRSRARNKYQNME
eukprot:gnl/Trimastix_PCT/2308.p1 GENE.gnl/Trimastix_PCT/2308~~gnl/Trimastix_PCT/2308.p1  ORF type:complete len:515 (-),score=188.89 gnl/Trimastix_PCT/2308:102-1646(-)